MNWIYIAKGIGIVLVVIGHFHPAYSPIWWSKINNVIYSFHMPLFFILSGYLYNEAKYSYKSLVFIKLKRLGIPFLSLSIIILFIKTIASHFVRLNQPVNFSSLYTIFLNPSNSYVGLLWFVHTLFFIFLLYPAIKTALKKDWAIVIIFIILNSFIPTSNRIIVNLPFFAFGLWLQNWKNFKPFLPLVLLFFPTYILFSSFDIFIFQFLLGIIGSLAVISISQHINSKMFLNLGLYSMTIYLFHTVFESTVRIIFQGVSQTSQFNFLICAIIAILTGILAPIFAEKLIIQSKIAKKLILGTT